MSPSIIKNWRIIKVDADKLTTKHLVGLKENGNACVSYDIIDFDPREKVVETASHRKYKLDGNPSKLKGETYDAWMLWKKNFDLKENHCDDITNLFN